jgi:hypothetical protein
MADIACKIERGPNGGYGPYIKLTSPALVSYSGQWFKLHPDGAGEGFEYPMAVTAENMERPSPLPYYKSSLTLLILIKTCT